MIDLDALKASDIPHILEAVNRHLIEQGLYAITDNIFVRPEVLAKRWELSLSCLSHWRFTGGGPLFMKTGPGPKAKVRYPLLGRNGVLDFESQRLYGSTAEESAFRQKP